MNNSQAKNYAKRIKAEAISNEKPTRFIRRNSRI
jgi:hypothetical protein